MGEKFHIGTNTKMYKTIADTVSFLEKLEKNTLDISREEMTLFVIPSFTALDRARRTLRGDSILLGAQNMCWEDRGPFTGEISPLMLKEIGVDLVEIGHSERRRLLGETDEDVNRKILAALRHGFSALLCVGETEAQRNFGIADDVLRMQIRMALHGAGPIRRCLVAYEPVWAIGAGGTPATPEYAEERHRVIRETLASLHGAEGADVPILYGGSVDDGNAPDFAAMGHIDGLFIGRAAWDADDFDRIIRAALPRFRDKEARRG